MGSKPWKKASSSIEAHYNQPHRQKQNIAIQASHLDKREMRDAHQLKYWQPE